MGRLPPLLGRIGLALTVLTLAFPTASSALDPTSGSAAQVGKAEAEELPVAALLAPFRATDGRSAAHVWLEIPGPAALQASRQLGARQLHVKVEIFGRLGRLDGSFEGHFDLSSDDIGDAVGRSALRIHGTAVLAPGPYTLQYRVTGSAVQDDGAKGHGAKGNGTVLAERRLPFEIAAFETDYAALLPPFFIDEYGQDDLDDGLVIRTAAGDETPDPFVTASEETFVPKIVPVLGDDSSRARLVLMGYHLTREQSLLEAVLMTAEGDLLGKDRLALIRDRVDEDTGLERLDFALQTEGLLPGEYQLEVSIQDLENTRVDQTLMPFEIR